MKIKELRRAKGWTQTDLAKKINVTAQVVSNWERGYTSLSAEDVQRLSQVFDVSMDDIAKKPEKDEEWDKLYQLVQTKGTEIEVKTLLRSAVHLSKGQLRDLLQMFEVIANSSKNE